MFAAIRSKQRALLRRLAVQNLFCHHQAHRTPDGRSRRLLQQWLTPLQWKQLTTRGYFDVIGSQSGSRYRIYTGSAMNVCLLDDKGRARRGLCFVPVGDLPAGDVMLAQKLALELCEDSAITVAKEFVPRSSYLI